MIEGQYRVQPLSRQDIRCYAKGLREMLRLSEVKYIDIIRLMEYIFPKVFKKDNYSFEIRTKEEMGQNHGLTDPRAGKIYLREDIYERACRGAGRDRFTAAHELGHFLLHDDVDVGFARISKNEYLPPYCDPEWQANAFAGEFLMDHDVIRDMTPTEIVSACGVSYAAACFQKKK